MKVPFVPQSEEADCGPACLASVLAFHGRHVTVGEITTHAGTDRDGTSAAGLRTAAEQWGLSMSAHRYPDGVLPAVAGGRPMIALLKNHHFVVVQQLTARRAVTVDPALGRRTVTTDSFLAEASGLYLTFSLTAAFVAGGRRESGALARLWSILCRHDRAALLFAAFASFVSGSALVGMALLVRSRMVASFTGDELQWVLAGLAVLCGVAAWLAAHSTSALVHRVALPVAERITNRLVSASSRFLDARFLGELSQRPQRLDSAVMTSVTTLTGAITTTASMLSAVAALVLISPLVAGVAMAGSMLASLVLLQGQQRAEGLGRQAAVHALTRDGDLLQSLTVMEVLRAEAAPSHILRRWVEGQQRCDEADDALTVHMQRRSRLAQTLDAATLLAVVVTAFATTHQAITTALVPLLASVLASAARSFAEGRLAIVTEAAASWRATDDALTAEPFTSSRRLDAALEPGSIQVADLSLSRSRSRGPLLTVPRLQINPADRLLITGMSGSGKSTLLRTLAGFQPSQAGQVTHANHATAYVPQRPMLLDGTVRENLQLGRALSDVRLEAAVAAVELDDVLDRRGGLAAVVVRGGANFSGGERQRLALARALAGEWDVLLLDEAFSAVEDALAERIWAQLAAADRTIIAVAHRLPRTLRSERLLQLDGGHLHELERAAVTA